jgi:16S rRNA (uracil1498-N3)-methyltransferase
MARRRFFVPVVRDGQAEIAGDDARHLTQVLRVEPGQRFEISDNTAAYLAEIATVRKTQVVFRVLDRLPDPSPEAAIHLLVSFFKFDRLEMLLEKATELGVTSVQFVRSERSDKGLDKAAEKRIERWRKIALEASQQSRRLQVPQLSLIARFQDALRANANAVRLFLDEENTGLPLVEAVPASASSVSIMVGPEGGWTDFERSESHEAGWTPVSMGAQILRSETAAIAALAIVNAVLRR